MTAIPLLTEDDVHATMAPKDEAGFGALRADTNVALPLPEHGAFWTR